MPAESISDERTLPNDFFLMPACFHQNQTQSKGVFLHEVRKVLRTCNLGRAPSGVFLRSISGTLQFPPQVHAQGTLQVYFKYSSGIITLRRSQVPLRVNADRMFGPLELHDKTIKRRL